MPALQAEHLIILIGTALTAGGIYAYLLRRRAERWPSTQAVITSSRVKRAFGGSYSEHLILKYAFTIADKVYHGNTLTAGGSFSWSASVPGMGSPSEALPHYPRDAEVTVYYDPEKPWLNALHQGNKQLSYWPIAIGLIAIIAAVISLAVSG